MKIYLLAIMLAVCTAGCNPQDAANMQRDTSRMAQDGVVSASNAQLVTRVGAVLTQIKGLDMSGLHIEAESGVVTLGGHVRSAHEKRLVANATENVRGVKSVVNKLRIVSVGS
jgi:hyperosmotically inducible protein